MHSASRPLQTHLFAGTQSTRGCRHPPSLVRAEGTVQHFAACVGRWIIHGLSVPLFAYSHRPNGHHPLRTLVRVGGRITCARCGTEGRVYFPVTATTGMSVQHACCHTRQKTAKRRRSAQSLSNNVPHQTYPRTHTHNGGLLLTRMLTNRQCVTVIG